MVDARQLPDFPWDRLVPYGARAAAAVGPAGMVDLSVGTPVDPTPVAVQAALASAANAPGYPTTHGTPAVRQAAAGWLVRRLGVRGADPEAVLPLIGTKEFVAWAPILLNIGPGDTVIIPSVAYPTYDVGARLAGAHVVVADDPADFAPSSDAGANGRVAAVWLNSPSNPTGEVLARQQLRAVVSWGRQYDAVVLSDECYIELGWTGQAPVSVLHPDVCGGSHDGVLAVHSLSKRSNLAGYRFGFVTGDPALVRTLLAIRKHAGMIVPAPVQAGAAVALLDDDHVVEQRARYFARRQLMLAALQRAGLRVDHSEAGLYLWATAGRPCWDTVGWFADRGVLVTPGDFYGVAGAEHVRVALTASDKSIALAVRRIAG